MVCAPVRRDNPRALARRLKELGDYRPYWIGKITQVMLYFTFTMISSVDLSYYGLPHAKDWVVFLWIVVQLCI